MTTEQSVEEKIRAGCYISKLEFPHGMDDESNAKRILWIRDMARLDKQLKEDVFKEHGIEKNPKAELCWNISWQRCNQLDVVDWHRWFGVLVNLIK